MIGEHLYPQSNLINGAVIQKKRGRFKLAFWLRVISCYLTIIRAEHWLLLWRILTGKGDSSESCWGRGWTSLGQTPWSSGFTPKNRNKDGNPGNISQAAYSKTNWIIRFSSNKIFRSSEISQHYGYTHCIFSEIKLISSVWNCLCFSLFRIWQ